VLVHVEGLSRLDTLSISSSTVTDAGLAHLRSLTNLQVLDLGDCPKISDKGLVHLKGLTRLRDLLLPGTQVSDAGLAHLKRLRNLQTLILHDTHVTDAGLAHLEGLSSLCREVVVTHLCLGYVGGLGIQPGLYSGR
jgi:Leucine-rich repeat (LRR) protein